MISKIFAKKLEMTGKYTPEGQRVGVTLLKYLPAKVLDLRTAEKHGYTALRLQMPSYRSKAMMTREVRTNETMEAGTEIKLEEVFSVGDMVNVAGISKGHGFTGAVKRYGFAGGPRTHGQSDRERSPGSSGSTTTPGRVYKGKRRAGHMGVDRVTVRRLKILDIKDGIISLIGSVPGAKNGLVEIAKI